MKRARAFTLIEILLVLALVGVILALSIPSLENRFEESSLQGTSRSVAQLLRVAQYRAISDERPTGVQIDEKERFLQMVQYPDQDSKKEATKPAPLKGDSLSRLELEHAIQWEGPAKNILYFPDGTTSGGVFHFKRGERIARVKVRPGLGRVEIDIQDAKIKS